MQNQVRLIDTVKYYQQSLDNLASSMTEIEKENVRKNFKRFLAYRLMFCNDEQEKWILDYLSSGKGIILYQMIKNFDSLKITPKDDFFYRKDFYSSLKEKDISEKDMKTLKNYVSF